MLGFLGIGGKVAIGLALALAIVTGGFYWYYENSQERISTLNQNNARLETAVSIGEETISSLQRDYEQAQKEIRQLNQKFQNIRQQNTELRERLSDHDIGVLAKAKPGLVERVINNASDNAGRCFEILSGAELTEEEKNAENARQFNAECPWLYDDLVND